VIAAASAVLAHQGGWDEALFVAVPIVVLLALLALAQRRAAAEQDAELGREPQVAPPEPDER
jgi:predicted secreted protein